MVQKRHGFVNLNWINDRDLQLTAFIKKILEQFGTVIIGSEFSPIQTGSSGIQNTITQKHVLSRWCDFVHKHQCPETMLPQNPDLNGRIGP